MLTPMNTRRLLLSLGFEEKPCSPADSSQAQRLFVKALAPEKRSGL